MYKALIVCHEYSDVYIDRLKLASDSTWKDRLLMFYKDMKGLVYFT